MINARDILLRIDLREAAKSIGLSARPSSELITEENLFKIINEIELALLANDSDTDISSICGLLWTHFGKKFDLLPEYIFKVMTKIGFTPVGSMLTDKVGNEKQLIAASSLISMFEIAAQMQKESLHIFNRKYYLTRFQKTLWEKLENKPRVAVSAPTSAGKSFLICLNLIYGTYRRGGISVYIVPTLTLMGQVTNDLIALSREHNQNISIRTHLDEDDDFISPTIYVLTQERLNEHNWLANKNLRLNYLVIDEVQNIERAFDAAGGDTRAKLLLDVLIDLHDNYSPTKTIISGPRIADVNILGEKLFRKPCTAVAVDSSPVTNISYSLAPSHNGGKIKLTQYTSLRERRLFLTSDNTIGATGFQKSVYDENYHTFLTRVLADNRGSLIFMPTSGQARKTAIRIAGDLKKSEDRHLIQLSEYIERTVSPQYDLAECVRKGVAFHHGKMPHHVRNAVELAVTQNRLAYVTCTTTLLQGVNIPVRNVFIRNPNLFIRRQGDSAPKLSGYEISNLRGRAGRLLKDFVGRTFILDGTYFTEEEEQLSLFQPEQKRLDGSYAEVFQQYRGEIISSLTDPVAPRGTLAKYISNTLYTNPDGAAQLLRKGITLTSKDLAEIKKAQLALTVEKSICKAHRFWDPYDLQKLHENSYEFTIPLNLFEDRASEKLSSALSYFYDLLPDQAEHYLNSKNRNSRYLASLAIDAVNWAKEVPLPKLLDSDFARTSSDNTDNAISRLQRTISYGIPALFSPLYAMRSSRASFLTQIERGGYNPSTISQINHNVPRETAITVTRRAKKDGAQLNTIEDVLNFLSDIKAGYWNAIQFRHLIDPKLITRH